MKLVRMLTGNRESSDNQKKFANNKLKSVIINDSDKLENLQKEINKIMNNSQNIEISDNLNKENKFYKKKDVLDMIKITKKHIDQLNKDSENSVNKFQSCLEKYREVLQERENLVNQLSEPISNQSQELSSIQTDLTHDTGKIQNFLYDIANNDKSKIQTLILLNKYEEQYEDNLMNSLSLKEKLNLILKIENKMMQMFFDEIERKEVKNLTCRNCKEYFNKDSNHMTACLKHTGQLKYEPCLKCKKSELFTCCGLCENCSIGCSPFEHISIV